MEALIAITYRCNARCRMCNTWRHPSNQEDEIRVGDIETLPDNLAFANITGGEPFLRADIEDFVDVLKRKSKRVVISTNGFLTERIVDVLGRHRDVGVRVSLEGLPKANDDLRGMKDGFDHGLRTLLRLQSLGLKDIGFGITVSERNAGDLMELYALARMMCVEFATAATHNSYYFHKYDNRFENPDYVAGEFKKLVAEMLGSRKIKDWFRAYLNSGLIDYVYGRPRLLPCGAARDVFFVDPFGEVRPCNAMDESMGNLKRTSFEEIRRSREADEVRRKASGCERNCWMVGTAAPAMKRRIWMPVQWIARNKWQRSE
ncbi:MAG: radical SAM protein [Candidatus Aquicultorales bacterium]